MKRKGIFIVFLSALLATACNNLGSGGNWGGNKSYNGSGERTNVRSGEEPVNDYVNVGGHEHVQGSIVTWQDATYEEPGYYIYACKTCGALVYMTLPQLRYDYSVGLEYEFNDRGDGFVVTGIGTCTDQDIIIPDVHQDGTTGVTLPVTEIGDRAFYNITFIVTVVCPGSIEMIGDKAFSGCDNLMEITIPDDVDFGVDVFRDTIYVEIVFDHNLIYVPRREASCYEEGCIAHYVCTDCGRYFSDSEGKNQIYDVTIARTHHFVGGVCTKCGQYQETTVINYVDSVPFLGRFPLGTLETAIGLPSYITVWTMDGYSHQVSVLWDLSTYDKAHVGTYTIYGYLQAAGYTFQDLSLAIVTAEIEVTEVMIGTADIVFILDISGSMTDEVQNVKNNLVSFANAVDNAGVSARYSIITFSDYTYTSSSSSWEQTQVIKNGASNWYTDASAAAYSINNIVLADGGDTPECDIDGLMMANYDLDYRQDARRFYILLTDAEYKNANHYGVSDMDEAINILRHNNVCVSVITSSYLADSTYYYLYAQTGGTYLNIDSSNFGTQLTNYLLPIIFQRVED